MAEVGESFLGRYTLLENLPAPAFVTTYLATDDNLNRRVEITILQPRFAAHAEFAARFADAAKRVMDLDHPAIARVYDVGTDAQTGSGFVVSEHVAGTHLSRYIRDHQPSINEALGLMENVFGALAQAHEAGVVHLGLTPHSIIVTSAGRSRLVGLGLLGIAANVAGSADALAATLDTSGYLAPEQITLAQGSAASDIYAAGLLLSQCLTGRPTWDGALRGDELVRRAGVPATLPGSVLPALDPELNSLIEGCLSISAASRPSAAEATKVLTGLRYTSLPATESLTVEAELAATELIDTPPARGASTAQPAVPQSTSTPSPGIDPTLASIFPASALSTREFSANEFTAGRTRSALVSTVVIAVSSIVAFAAIILFVVSTLPANFLPSTSRTVPNVVGMTFEEAMSSINSAGLTVARKDEASATVALDTIISSVPASGSKVEVGSEVLVSVSTGSTMVPVPNITGMPLAAAKLALTTAGLAVGTTTSVPSALAPKGGVVAAIPAVAAEVPAGTLVNLTVSNGLIRIPSLVGKSITDASATLTGPAIGITPIIKSKTSCSATNPISVATQSPEPGDVPRNTSVTLTYCSGR
jgi:serine/threonine-protein kinase